MSEIQHPINAFPENLQEIINHYSEVKGYPHEYFITALLAVVSTSAGRSVILNTGNYISVGIVWAAIVGKPGLIKSEAQTDAFRPVKNRQFEYINSYNRDVAELEAFRESNPKAKTKDLPQPPKFLLSDITPEALSMVLADNPKGCGIVYDELAGFVGRFNRYNSGADEQMFLSLFNGDTIIRTRVNGHGNAAVKNSFLSIVGTIQPSVLKKVFSDKADSGFFDRWLISFPEDVKKQYPNSFGVDPVIESRYEYIVKNILDIPYDEYDIKELKYSQISHKLIFDYQCKLIDIQNSTDNDQERSICAKMEIYLHRFALILQIIEYADIGSDMQLTTISEKSAQGAIILTKYFLSEAHKVRIINPEDSLKGQWREIYDQMPGHGINFTRLIFVKKCAEFGLGERIADAFLRNNSDRSETKLLYKIGQGLYTKNLF